jgi:hypothetical protein
MTIAELITKLQVLPQDIPVMVYESDPDTYVPVAEVYYCKEDAEPHIRLLTGMEDC